MTEYPICAGCGEQIIGHCYVANDGTLVHNKNICIKNIRDEQIKTSLENHPALPQEVFEEFLEHIEGFQDSIEDGDFLEPLEERFYNSMNQLNHEFMIVWLEFDSKNSGDFLYSAEGFEHIEEMRKAILNSIIDLHNINPLEEDFEDAVKKTFHSAYMSKCKYKLKIEIDVLIKEV